MNFIAIDPGLRGCGVAIFKDRDLLSATYVTNYCKKERGPEVWRGMAESVKNWVEVGQSSGWVFKFEIGFDFLLLEVPRIYPGARANDPADLMELAGVDGALAALAGNVCLRHYYPSDWKGQVEKDIMTARIQKAVTESERARVVRVGAKDHNTWDAVGIGLHYLGRLNKKVYA